MTSKEFVKNYKPELSEYCPCIIDWQGEVYECKQGGHLDTLIQINGNEDILSQVPENISPLLYLTAKLKCILVDYENQIYNKDMSQEQRYALLDLSEAKLILLNPKDINGKITV